MTRKLKNGAVLVLIFSTGSQKRMENGLNNSKGANISCVLVLLMRETKVLYRYLKKQKLKDLRVLPYWV
jgi:hypothetical protein